MWAIAAIHAAKADTSGTDISEAAEAIQVGCQRAKLLNDSKKSGAYIYVFNLLARSFELEGCN